jgi:predicted DNA-binding ribbon-helix-helix protein
LVANFSLPSPPSANHFFGQINYRAVVQIRYFTIEVKEKVRPVMCRLFVGAEPNLWASHTRSIRMDGMVTSVRLESRFWMVLEEIAANDDLNVPQLLHQLYNESIDEGHDLGNFTSFLRVCCLRYIDLQLQGLIPSAQNSTFDALPTEAILKIEAEKNRARALLKSRPKAQH